MARQRGHHEASHVVWIGKSGWKDWELKRVLLGENWVLVTKNSEDFRGLRRAPGTKGQYADVSLHAGLVCLNGPVGMDLALQKDLFSEALDELDVNDDLTNQILEVTLEDSEIGIQIVRYSHPRSPKEFGP
jgi:hypothetical protein